MMPPSIWIVQVVYLLRNLFCGLLFFFLKWYSIWSWPYVSNLYELWMSSFSSMANDCFSSQSRGLWNPYRLHWQETGMWWVLALEEFCLCYWIWFILVMRLLGMKNTALSTLSRVFLTIQALSVVFTYFFMMISQV